MFHKLDRWDIAGSLYLNHYCKKSAINRFFALISRLGDGVFWYSFIVILPILYGIEGLKISTLMFASGLICVVIYKQLKKRLVRERPFIRSTEIFPGCAPLDQYSFPSGHTMHAACFSTIALWHLPEFMILLLPFSILVALSRMVLGLHYPSDVICGAGLGITLGTSANYFITATIF
ncbi:MAG: undecaprenyl-diphosphatase [Pseudohongiellaceae bacterium]|jgi:undecaprenyl-diphosphatase